MFEKKEPKSGGHPKVHAPKHMPEHETAFTHHHKKGSHVDSHIPHMDHIRKNYHGK